MKAARLKRTGEASTAFADDRGAAITVTVNLWPSAGEADSFLDAWAEVARSPCAADMVRRHTLAGFEKGGPNEGATGVDVKPAEVMPLDQPATGDRVVALRSTIDVKTDTAAGQFVGDFVVIRAGRATASLELGDINHPFEGPRDALVRVITERLQNLS